MKYPSLRLHTGEQAYEPADTLACYMTHLILYFPTHRGNPASTGRGTVLECGLRPVYGLEDVIIGLKALFQNVLAILENRSRTGISWCCAWRPRGRSLGKPTKRRWRALDSLTHRSPATPSDRGTGDTRIAH